jgi:transposase
MSFLETWDVAYVADSALITQENVKLMAAKKVRFISRLPGRFNLEQELIDRAWKEGKWRFCGPMAEGEKAARYWTQPFEVEFVGRIYRFIVVRSSSLDKTKEKTLQRLLNKEKKALEKYVKTLSKEEFQCQPDAEARRKAVLKEHQMLHGLTATVVENVSVNRKPGRPRKHQPEPPLETITYGIEWTIHPPTEQELENWRQRKTAFVLITSVPEALYDDYREKTTISLGNRKKVQRPTARLLLNMLNSILVVYPNYDDRTERHFPHDINPEVLHT